ncbi:sensor histidine kinase [Halocola ammonii]
MKNSRNKWLIIYWSSFVVLLTAINASYLGLWLGNFLINLLRTPTLIVISILIFSYILKSAKWHPILKALAIISSLVIAGVMNRVLFGLFIYPHYFAGEYTFEYFNWYKIAGQFIIYIAAIGGHGSVVFLYDRIQWQKKHEMLLREKRSVQLDFLRAQVHPHFLFNTLNGIYSEVIKKSDKAGEMLLKISDLLRFMLYECQNERIQLSKEIELIDNFISLEKLRYGSRLDVRFNIEKESLRKELIPPLVFFAFVENSFKHGVGSQVEDSFVHIEIGESSDRLVFKIVNSSFSSQIDFSGHQKGIGLKNIRNQLDLIFDSNYELIQQENRDFFSTKLTIPKQHG